MILRKKMRKKRDKLDKQIPKLDELLKKSIDNIAEIVYSPQFQDLRPRIEW